MSNTTHLTSSQTIAMVDGGAAGDITVTGIESQDELVSVTHLSSATNVLSTEDLTDEFSVTADDTINNTGGTSTADGALLVVWNKKSPYGV